MIDYTFGNIFGEDYVEGAVVSTAGKPLYDGNIDVKNPTFPKKTRQQINYHNVNFPDIQAMVKAITKRTFGISINTQIETEYEEFNEAAEKYIEIFCEQGVGELSGIETFNSSMRLISSMELLHGGVIIRHHYNIAWEIPYRYELVGVDMIDSSVNNIAIPKNKQKQTIRNGIVRNKWGEITHLFLYTDPKKTKSKKVSYKNLTYFSNKWVSIDQQVAISSLTPMLQKLDSTGQYEAAELATAIEQAKAGNYMTSTTYDEIMQLVNKKIKQEGTQKDNIKDIVDLATPALKSLRNLGIVPNKTTPIPSSSEVLFDTSKRDSVYTDINKNSEMKSAASIGMSDLGIYSKAGEVNYSAIKYIIQNDKMSGAVRRDDFTKKLMKDIIQRVIRVGIQAGVIPNRVEYRANPREYHKIRFLVQNDMSIEPVKDALANEKNLELGLTTKGMLIEEQTGVKFETFLLKSFQQDILEQKLKEKTYKAAGMKPPTEDKVKKIVTDPKALANYIDME